MTQYLRLLAGATIAFISAQTASGADLPARVVTKAPPPIATPLGSWTGLYVGAGGGYGMYDANSMNTGAAGAVTFGRVNGTTGGQGPFGNVQIGADLQFADRFVAGVFGDFDFSSIKGTIGDMSTPGYIPLKQRYADAAGARIGYLVTPQILGYFDAGYTHAQFSSGAETFAPTGALIGVNIPRQNYDGYFLGGGTEVMIVPGWFVKTEYRYASYGSKTTAALIGPPATTAFGLTSFNETIKPNVQTIRTDLVYKFNWGRL